MCILQTFIKSGWNKKNTTPHINSSKKNEPIIFGELLLNELDIIKPKKIICLGKVAEEFFSDTPILKIIIYLKETYIYPTWWPKTLRHGRNV